MRRIFKQSFYPSLQGLVKSVRGINTGSVELDNQIIDIIIDVFAQKIIKDVIEYKPKQEELFKENGIIKSFIDRSKVCKEITMEGALTRPVKKYSDQKFAVCGGAVIPVDKECTSNDVVKVVSVNEYIDCVKPIRHEPQSDLQKKAIKELIKHTKRKTKKRIHD